MINMGIIGCGEWGSNHIRIFSQLKDARVLMACDLDCGRLTAMQKIYADIIFTKSYKAVLENKDIAAVCIATPSSTHYMLAKKSLNAGKHVICEKPLALTSEQCAKLAGIAEQKNLILMAGYIFLFNKGIHTIKHYIKIKKLGKIQYIYSKRTNLGPFRYDVNALWDLAPHDISIFNFLLDSVPRKVSACAGKYLSSEREDVAFITLIYPKKILVNIHVSWLDPKKKRQVTIIGDTKMLVWDDLDQQYPIKIYNKHVDKKRHYNSFGEFQLLCKEGGIIVPSIKLEEPLKNQNEYFLDCINKKIKNHVSNAIFASNITKTLEVAEESIEQSGHFVTIQKGVL